MCVYVSVQVYLCEDLYGYIYKYQNTSRQKRQTKVLYSCCCRCAAAVQGTTTITATTMPKWSIPYNVHLEGSLAHIFLALIHSLSFLCCVCDICAFNLHKFNRNTNSPNTPVHEHNANCHPFLFFAHTTRGKGSKQSNNRILSDVHLAAKLPNKQQNQQASGAEGSGKLEEQRVKSVCAECSGRECEREG